MMYQYTVAMVGSVHSPLFEDILPILPWSTWSNRIFELWNRWVANLVSDPQSYAAMIHKMVDWQRVPMSKRMNREIFSGRCNLAIVQCHANVS